MIDTTIAVTHGAAPRTRPSFAARLAVFLTSVREARRQRREAATLRGLDDRTLADIGLNRSQIDSIVRFGRD